MAGPFATVPTPSLRRRAVTRATGPGAAAAPYALIEEHPDEPHGRTIAFLEAHAPVHAVGLGPLTTPAEVERLVRRYFSLGSGRAMIRLANGQRVHVRPLPAWRTHDPDAPGACEPTETHFARRVDVKLRDGSIVRGRSPLELPWDTRAHWNRRIIAWRPSL